MTYPDDASVPKLQMTLEELANAPPILATEEMPDDLREMLTQQTGLFVRSDDAPEIDFATEPVPGVPGLWKVVGSTEFLRTIPGREQLVVEKGEEPARDDGGATDGYRPPWVDLEFIPRLVPFRTREAGELHAHHIYLEPRPRIEAERSDG